MTIAQYNKVVTQENKESLAVELCDKYVRNPIISINPKDFLTVMEGADALSITEVDGDNMAEMIHELTKHSYGSNSSKTLRLIKKVMPTFTSRHDKN
jgi:hypothetical protein